MYLYLFDSFLAKKKYKKILDRIETRITDLEISGRIVRLTILENIQEIIKDALKKGIETIVVVGNDKTFCQAAGALADSSATLGLIPIGEENRLAEILGIPKEELACEVLSARLVEIIDLARVNHYFFLSSIEISSQRVLLRTADYKISLSSKINKIKISNLDSIFKKINNPRDGLLEIILQGSIPGFFSFFKTYKEGVIDSLFFLEKIKIESLKKKKEIPILVDNWRILKTPLEIEIVPHKLKVIVGKERKF